MTRNTSRQTAPRPAPPAEPLVDREVYNPYFRWLVHLGVPLSVSLFVHAVLFVFLAVQSWNVFARSRSTPPGKYEVALRDAATLTPPPEQQLRWPGEHLDELDTAAPPDNPFDLDALAETANLADLAHDEPSLNPGELGTGGFGIGESGRSGVLGIGAGAGEGGGGGLGAGFGTGSGIGRAGVWNLHATGSRFAYVIDFSGSIVVAVDDLKRELKRSIGRLTSKQSFDVFIFYSTGTERVEHFKTEAFMPRLVAATPQDKRRFFAWIDRKAPQGRTEPLAAMKRAIALHPDAIFFFSDGMFDDKIVDQIARANRKVRAQIHCLVFDELLLSDTSGMPRLTEGARRLKRIADASGGKTRVITGADLGR